MTSNARKWAAAAAGAVAIGALAVATPAIAGAAGSVAGSVTAATSSPNADQGGRGGMNETPLTGETKDKVEAAALASVPGATVIRVETDADGVYEAHLRKADGTEVEVKVDKDFNVTAVNERTGRGPGGRGGNETPLTGETRDKAEAAALAKVPGATVVRSETDEGGTYEVHLRKSDGTHVVVALDSSFAVTSVDERSGREGKGGPGGIPDGQTALTGDTKTKAEAAALAKVPGTVIRATTDRQGVYEVHVQGTDGTEYEVALDASFRVTAVNEVTGRGPGGKGPHDGSGSGNGTGQSTPAPGATTQGSSA